MREGQAAVAADVVAVLVVRVEPHRVPAMHAGPAAAAHPRLAAVVRAPIADRVAEHFLVVQRVHLELHVVERPADVAVEELPGRAAVFAAVRARAELGHVRARRIDAGRWWRLSWCGASRGARSSAGALAGGRRAGACCATRGCSGSSAASRRGTAAATAGASAGGAVGLKLRFNVRHDRLRVLLRDREADAAELAGRQPVRQPLPRLAAVSRLVDAPVGRAVDALRIEDALFVATAHERPRIANAIPERHVEDVRVDRIHQEPVRAGHRRIRQAVQLRPRLAAVHRLVQSAAADRAPDVAQRGHVHDVGVRRMEPDARDVVGVLQADVLERRAAIRGLVDAVAPGGGVPLVAFAGADPDDLRILLVDLDVADRRRAVVVEDRRPARAAVVGFPDAARRGPHDHVGPVVLERIDRGDAADQIGVADVAPAQVFQHRIGRGRAGLGREHGAKETDEQEAGQTDPARDGGRHGAPPQRVFKRQLVG